ncbi:DUF397 domain-containing protein [Streptomyces sp. G45]|uniref:DUF397 domain-containing protein n=1 Tax=Streptomyces sp. G45 TaxID=3406627 RepID=UPI003C211E33
MHRNEPHTTAWIKSSYSGDNGGNCIEIAPGIPDVVPVRDSKTPDTPALLFQRSTWQTFVTAIRQDTFHA